MKKILFFTLLSLLFVAPLSAQQSKELKVGDPAPNFTLPDPSGKEVSLESLQGKWVVLDFWGSWCRWCIKGFPEMKSCYNDLKGKATFVGVACRDQKETWLNAIKEYELPWLNLWVDPTDQTVMQKYQLRGFPTKMVIDPKGVIRNITLGEDPDFYPTLRNLLK
ncbi:MAG: TlpA family protein disulfide reductase [Bacteroides sp.]|nr:TlpA family protein disulfide reductase [Bacteroides sp.]MCM1379286.1 TlpA family protein disulfide reductase [Bacteroides sp.]MCM1445056.1 TlpA family protein disulfide reductase [Prevotella sp.]